MTALLKDALDPNLVQTLENNPAIIHGGPFANIAHGCNSVLATKLSLSLADYTITEAGFGADLGAEKFLDIKCRYAGIAPSACVLVATVRALKSHGGVAKADLNQPNLEAVKAGASNLIRHIDNLKNGFGLPVVVAINAFPTDTAEEQAYVEQVCAEQGVPCVLSEVFAKGGEGGKALAEKVLEILEDRPIQYTYPLEMPLKDKINAIATKIYRADGVNYTCVKYSTRYPATNRAPSSPDSACFGACSCLSDSSAEATDSRSLSTRTSTDSPQTLPSYGRSRPPYPTTDSAKDDSG